MHGVTHGKLPSRSFGNCLISTTDNRKFAYIAINGIFAIAVFTLNATIAHARH